MVKVTIDGRTVEVPAGTLVTDAARAAEVHVPIFCSHSKLPPLGACRICVVEVGTPKLGADRKPVLGADGNPEIAWMPKVQTGCTTPVTDGMHVRTASATATKARKGVMEFLLVNHPLDCPVCDEGGECQLQDLAFAFGHDGSRMDEAKRTFDSEDLGPIVKKEANRCIVCMRCVRYCDEVMGENALTSHQRGVHTEISSFDRQPLACEQCGNCVEVCPVGALTALPYRFKARPWDLRQHISVCEWCSNGCSVRLGVRGMEILRARGTEFRGVNQEYLCVRGRFGHDFVNAPDRLTSPLVRQGAALQPASSAEAIAYAAARLRDIAATHGADSIAFLGGEKLNLEEQYLLQKLARDVLGTANVDARTRPATAVAGDAVLRATGGGRPSLTFESLYQAQEALVLFEDLQGEAPLAQAAIVRGFRQRGLHVTVAHARRVKLARPKFKGDWLGLRPGAELALTLALTKSALDLGVPANVPGEVASALESLKGSLAGWTPERIESETGVSGAAVAAAAKRMRDAERKALLFGRGVVPDDGLAVRGGSEDGDTLAQHVGRKIAMGCGSTACDTLAGFIPDHGAGKPGVQGCRQNPGKPRRQGHRGEQPREGPDRLADSPPGQPSDHRVSGQARRRPHGEGTPDGAQVRQHEFGDRAGRARPAWRGTWWPRGRWRWLQPRWWRRV